MRILNLIHQYLPEFVGGTELYTQALTQTLQREGHDTAIFHRAYEGAPLLRQRTESGVTVFAAGAGPLSPTQRFLSTFRHASLHRVWLETLDAFQPDLVHVQHLMGLPISLLNAVLERHIPYLITLHDYWWLCANANLLTDYSQTICDGPRWHLNCTHCVVARAANQAAWLAAPATIGALSWRALQLRRLMDGARMLVTPSDFVNRWYVEHGAPATNVRTLRLGVSPPDTDPLPRAHSDHELDMLYVGGLAPNKGIHVLVEAFNGVRGDARLTIVGDESAHPDYASSLHKLAGPGVQFAGRLDRSQVWQAMRSADVVLVPSLWQETFCLVAHEALAAGTPVVASHVGALTEAIQHEMNGLLVPPGDAPAWRAAMQRLVDNPDLLARYRAHILPPLTFSDHAERVLALYLEVLTAPNRVPTPDRNL